jgi:hypothetical protein
MSITYYYHGVAGAEFQPFSENLISNMVDGEKQRLHSINSPEAVIMPVPLVLEASSDYISNSLRFPSMPILEVGTNSPPSHFRLLVDQLPWDVDFS